MNVKEKLGILAGGIVVSVVMGIGGLLYLETGEVNPITAINVSSQMNKENKLILYRDINKVFGPNGYANKDGKSGLSFEEQADVYERMGLGLFIEGQTKFPYNPNHVGRLSPRQLEKAVKSYETENQ